MLKHCEQENLFSTKILQLCSLETASIIFRLDALKRCERRPSQEQNANTQKLKNKENIWVKSAAYKLSFFI